MKTLEVGKYYRKIGTDIIVFISSFHYSKDFVAISLNKDYLNPGHFSWISPNDASLYEEVKIKNIFIEVEESPKKVKLGDLKVGDQFKWPGPNGALMTVKEIITDTRILANGFNGHSETEVYLP